MLCPICKGDLDRSIDNFVCSECATEYSQEATVVGHHEETYYDFRIHKPAYCVPENVYSYNKIQREYETFQKERSEKDDEREFVDEIDSVKEIYTDEFNMSGSILDVGGHQGRLRHFLNRENVACYVDIDPYPEVFRNIQFRHNLLKTYPCLSEPCNFVAAHAEHLPFTNKSYDIVHMRSCIDHFSDPFLALKEAHRVLKPGGWLMIGVAIMERLAQTGSRRAVSVPGRLFRSLRYSGLRGTLQAVSNRLRQQKDHTFHLTYDNLIDLVRVSGFRVEKEHWQKHPLEHCIYLSATVQKQ